MVDRMNVDTMIRDTCFRGIAALLLLPCLLWATERSAQSGCQVTLRVVNEAGHPLKGVSVEAVEAKISPDLRLPNLAFTDPNGWVTLGTFEPKLPVTFFARQDGFAISRTTLTFTNPDQIQMADIVLEEGLDVPGLAQYADGTPATGMKLNAQPDWYQGRLIPESFGVDAQGQFVLRHILAGTYHIYMTPDTGNLDATSAIQISQITLPPSDGEMLTLRIPQHAQTSLAHNGFEPIFLPGQRQSRQRPTSPPLNTSRPPQGLMRGGMVPIQRPRTGMVPGQRPSVQPEGPFGQIQGIVYNANGHPAPFVNLTVTPGSFMKVSARGETWARVITDANGLYRVESAPADRVCVVRRGRLGSTDPGVTHRACVPMAGSTVHLDFGQGYTITGTIQRDGVPQDHVNLRVTGPDGTSSQLFGCNGSTDAAGRFLIRGIPSGRYGVDYRKPRYRGPRALATIAEIRDQDIDLGLLDMKTTTVEVLLSRANPDIDLSAWQVYIVQGDTLSGTSISQTQGYAETGIYFELDAVQAGSYSLVASQDGPIRYRVPFEIPNPGEPLTVQLAIPTGSAKILSPANLDDSAFLLRHVKLSKDDGSTGVGLRWRDGLPMQGLSAGTYHLSANVYPALDPIPIQTFQLAEGQSKTLDLGFISEWSLRHAALVVYAADDRGTLHYPDQVQLEGPQGSIQGVLPNSGDSALFLVPSGDYVLTVQCDGYRPYTESLHLTAPEQDPWQERTVKIVLLTPN